MEKKYEKKQCTFTLTIPNANYPLNVLLSFFLCIPSS
jgi:hypothetical protein